MENHDFICHAEDLVAVTCRVIVIKLRIVLPNSNRN